MLACWLFSVGAQEAEATQFSLAFSGLAAVSVGLAVKMGTRDAVDLTRRDGFAVVAIGWVVASCFGALPFLLSGTISGFIPAVFETMSGFTTTGASVIPNVEIVPRSILLWRSVTHLFGGMGVLVLCVAILPFLGIGGMQLYRAEMPGPAKDRLTPRIATTAKLLWGVYILMGLLETLLLRLGGMSWFDAVCHACGSIATGGFSTRNASIGAYHSLYIEIVTMAFMFLAGVNFSLHYRALQGRPLSYFKDAEFRAYFAIWLAAGLLVSVNLWARHAAGFAHSLRAAFFQVTSIMTTTGFATEDFDRWPSFSRLLLVLLMFVGGCAGSTGGGIKVSRLLVVFKSLAREARLYLQPQAVLRVKFGGEILDPSLVSNIVAFVVTFCLIFTGASLLMCFFAPNIVTAATSVAATLGNIGPGLGAVGPMVTYADIPHAGKIILTLCMLLGRLELYTVLVLFMPSFWKK